MPALYSPLPNHCPGLRRSDIIRSVRKVIRSGDIAFYLGVYAYCVWAHRPGWQYIAGMALCRMARRWGFIDVHFGTQKFLAGSDFGDFVVWRRDDVPAYQLTVVVDDAEMRISEVVRGKDLLKSTARQILLYGALGATIPAFYHCDLVLDEAGQRLAKRHDALSLRRLRQTGWTAQQVIEKAGVAVRR